MYGTRTAFAGGIFVCPPPIFILTFLIALLLGFSSRQADAAVYFVSTTGTGNGSSWATAGPLQTVLTTAHSGDQVWVKFGTYTGNFTATDGVAVYGHFAGTETSINTRPLTNAAYATILDSNGSGTVYTIPTTATGTNTLDGFTVRNGNGTAAGKGGGLDNRASDTIVIANCTFTNNTSSAGGGFSGIGIQNISNCAFTSNSSANGGGYYCDSNTTSTIVGCTFSQNTASDSGGGIFSNGGTSTVSACTFTGNTAANTLVQFGGGGLCADGGTATITDCVFTSNAAGYDGGGLFALNGTCAVNHCAFLSNTGIDGGGVNAFSDTTTFDGSTFTGNSASNHGGGILTNGNTTSIAHCVFMGNSGKGVYAIGMATVADSTFESNTPNALGLEQSGTSSTPSVVEDNLIVGISTGGNGPDGIDVDMGGNDATTYAAIVNNTVLNANIGINIGTAGGAIIAANNILDGNYGGLNDAGGVLVISSHNDVYANVSYGYQGISLSSSDLQVNPLFTSAANRDYRLASNSPLINVGDDGEVGTGDTDLDGNPRIYGAHVDIGAYEEAPLLWTATAVSAAPGGMGHILWTRSDGAASLWTLNGGDVEVTEGPTYGPYAGWTAKAVATANDGTSRVLWTNANGMAGIWTFNAGDVETAVGATYGPYAGWSAKSIGVAGNGTSRVLWTNSDGVAGVWSFGANDTETGVGPTYGPYSGWNAVSLATNTSGVSQVLWDNVNGEAGVWSFNASDVETVIGPTYGPYSGWTAGAIGAAGDGTSRVLWTNVNGKAGLWSFNANDIGTIIGTTYGPYSGYGAVALGAASDGTARVLWDRSDRAAGAWSFGTNDAETVIGSVYGPY